MARGRKKQEVEEGYIKERFIVDLVLNESELATINEIGKTKYISDLVKKDFNAVKDEEASYNLTVTDEIREKFNNDPRRAYLLGQLLTEFYCNIKTEPTQIINTKAEAKISTVTKVEKEKIVEIEEIAVEKDVEVRDEIIESVQKEIDEKVKENFSNHTEEPIWNNKQENIQELVVEKESDKNEESNPTQGDGRVGRLNTAPLMKKRLGSK